MKLIYNELFRVILPLKKFYTCKKRQRGWRHTQRDDVHLYLRDVRPMLPQARGPCIPGVALPPPWMDHQVSPICMPQSLISCLQIQVICFSEQTIKLAVSSYYLWKNPTVLLRDQEECSGSVLLCSQIPNMTAVLVNIFHFFLTCFVKYDNLLDQDSERDAGASWTSKWSSQQLQGTLHTSWYY